MLELRVRLVPARQTKCIKFLHARGQTLRFEHFREQRASEMAEAPAAREAHSFGRFTDPLPFGSSSVGLDIAFPRASNAYGLPERHRVGPADRLEPRHASGTARPMTRSICVAPPRLASGQPAARP